MPVDQLFQYFNETQKFSTWYHWERMPPDGAKVRYQGPIAGLGSRYQWGNQEKDKYSNRYEIIETISNQQVKGRLTVSGKSAEIVWSFNTTKDHKTLVNWSYKGAKIPFYLQLFSWLQKDEITHSVTMALDRLEKKLFEKNHQASGQAKYTISEKKIYPMPYVRLLAMSQETSENPEEIQTAFLETSSKIRSYLRDYKGYDDTVIGPAAMIFRSWDTRLDKVVFYAGIIIHKKVPTEEDMEIKTFLGSKVLKAVYEGCYKNLINAYRDLKKYAHENGFTVSTNSLEIFPQGADGSSLQNKIIIYLPVKGK